MLSRSLLPLLVALVFLGGCATPPSPEFLASLHPVQNPAPRAEPGVYDINQVDVIPAVISPSLPTYPFELRKASITGSARILLTVRKDGSVTGAMVKDATNQLFGDSALNAAWETKFRPAQLHGEPVDCRFLLPILFNLKN